MESSLLYDRKPADRTAVYRSGDKDALREEQRDDDENDCNSDSDGKWFGLLEF